MGATSDCHVTRPVFQSMSVLPNIRGHTQTSQRGRGRAVDHPVLSLACLAGRQFESPRRDQVPDVPLTQDDRPPAGQRPARYRGRLRRGCPVAGGLDAGAAVPTPPSGMSDAGIAGNHAPGDGDIGPAPRPRTRPTVVKGYGSGGGHDGTRGCGPLPVRGRAAGWPLPCYRVQRGVLVRSQRLARMAGGAVPHQRHRPGAVAGQPLAGGGHSSRRRVPGLRPAVGEFARRPGNDGDRAGRGDPHPARIGASPRAVRSGIGAPAG